MGAMDNHCTDVDGGAIVQETSQASCMPVFDSGTPVDAGTSDAGASDAGSVADSGVVDAGPPPGEYGPTLYNQEGDDDDCKYHVKWTSTPIYEDYNVTFSATVTSRVDGSAVKGANTIVEVYLNDTHPAPNTNPVTTDNGDGSYSIGPIQFDASGQWTVRFHIFEQCDDTLDDSPHGHAAFYINVP